MPAFNQKRLSTEEVDCIMKAKKLELSNCEIARRLGVTEGAVRYRLKQASLSPMDGRKNKPSELDRFMPYIKLWIDDYKDEKKRPSVKLLYESLVEKYAYCNSYDALRRYIRKHFPDFLKKKVWLRVETPPGVLLQVDWKEDVKVQMGEAGNWVVVQALVFTLGFSTKPVVVYSELRDLASFIRCHQEGFRRLGGFAQFIRPDCLSSAVKKWRGLNSELNSRYERYIRGLGLEVFPSRPYTATDKGKVEKRIRDFFSRMDFKHQVFRDMSDLQTVTDLKLKELDSCWRCSSTGLSVGESFNYEQTYLRPLPQYFPALPVRERHLRVRNDGTVNFCNNYYQLGRTYVGQNVLCVNTGEEVIIYHRGQEVKKYAYLPQSRGMVMLSEEVLRDESYEISELVRDWGLEVARRQVGIYHEVTLMSRESMEAMEFNEFKEDVQ